MSRGVKNRPISLTSIVGKLMESIIAKNYAEHLDTILLTTQHGLTKGKLCLTKHNEHGKVCEAADGSDNYHILYLKRLITTISDALERG